MESTCTLTTYPERFIGRIWLKGQGYVTLISQSQGTAKNPEFLEKLPELRFCNILGCFL